MQMATALTYVIKYLDAFHAQAVRDGGEFTAPPTALLGQRIARLRDADGAQCSIGGP
jgi:hypothetical protein